MAEWRAPHHSSAARRHRRPLGFSIDDSHGNFAVDRDVGASPDDMALADLILTALYTGYGARAATPLAIDAPFAPAPTSRCDPMS